MLKQTMKRCGSLLLALTLVIGLLPAVALTAGAKEALLADELLEAKGDFSPVTGGIKVEAASQPYEKGSCGDTNAASKTTEITLTSTLPVEAQLSFEYKLKLGNASGYVQVDDQKLAPEEAANAGTVAVLSGMEAGEAAKAAEKAVIDEETEEEIVDEETEEEVVDEETEEEVVDEEIEEEVIDEETEEEAVGEETEEEVVDEETEEEETAEEAEVMEEAKGAEDVKVARVAAASGTTRVDLNREGVYTAMVPAYGTVTITLFSGEPNSTADKTKYTTTATLTNFSLAVDKDVATTFLPAENGSYTVDGTAVTEAFSQTRNAMEKTALKATPAEGYQFLGWYSVEAGKYASLAEDWTTYLMEDQTLQAKFVPASAPVFQVGKDFVSPELSEAAAFAQAGAAKTVVLVKDGTLEAGDYVIPEGVTLLIPYNEAYTLCTTEPVWHKNDASASSAKAYKTLTMAAGASITVQSGGAISVAARAQNTTPNAGLVLGPWGLVQMEADSKITLESGANLYCWGFITGSGNVLAQNGAKVYEDFQIPTFRGGNASSSMSGGNKNKVFPFAQYYVQNIEVPLTLEAGATETVCTGVVAGGMLGKGSGVLIGQNEGLFRLTSGSMTKRYDGAADRLVVEIDGEAQIAAMTVKIYINVDSADYVLPITNNMTIQVNNGSNIEIVNDVAILPGAVLRVDEGAAVTLKEGADLFVYDYDEWNGKGYVNQSKSNFVPLANVPGRSYQRTDADIVDAAIDMNGTFTVNGGLYTTAGGANVATSQGTGTVIFGAAAGTEKNTYQVTQTSNTVAAKEVPITPAKLKNAAEGVNEYSVTADAQAGDTFYYHDGMWDKKNAPEGDHYPHIQGNAWAYTAQDHWLVCQVCGMRLGENEGHTLAHHERVEASCVPGNIEYWSCETCGALLGNGEDGQRVVIAEADIALPAVKSHTLTKTEAKDPTCTEDGNIDYWTCSGCQGIFSDAAGKKKIETEDTIVEKLGHDWHVTFTRVAGTNTANYVATCSRKAANGCEDLTGEAVVTPATSGRTTTYTPSVELPDGKTPNGKVTIRATADECWTYTAPAPSRPDPAPAPEENLDEPDAPLTETPMAFEDVKEDDWYRDAVKFAVESGIMKGVSDTSFAPMEVTTRGSIITMLHRLETEPEGLATFPDVASTEWYGKAVAWGADHGIVKGYDDGTFAPDESVTREQLAAILYRYASFKGYDVSASAGLDTFADGGEVSSWAQEAVRWAVGMGLIQGKGGNRLDPAGTASRGEAAAMMMRFDQLVAQKG